MADGKPAYTAAARSFPHQKHTENMQEAEQKLATVLFSLKSVLFKTVRAEST